MFSIITVSSSIYKGCVYMQSEIIYGINPFSFLYRICRFFSIWPFFAQAYLQFFITLHNHPHGLFPSYFYHDLKGCCSTLSCLSAFWPYLQSSSVISVNSIACVIHRIYNKDPPFVSSM